MGCINDIALNMSCSIRAEYAVQECRLHTITPVLAIDAYTSACAMHGGYGPLWRCV